MSHEDHPRDPLNPNRFLCLAEHPMPGDHSGQWVHPNARIVGGCAEGCCDDYQCPNCGVKWRYECPA